jgi:hypothetical protein
MPDDLTTRLLVSAFGLLMLAGMTVRALDVVGRWWPRS